MTEFEVGAVYVVFSRNLFYAVYVGSGQFIGIREKFGSRYLDSEWIRTEKGGTLEVLGFAGRVSDSVKLREDLGVRCENCGYRVRWTGPPAPAPWEHRDITSCLKAAPILIHNDRLFAELEKYGKGSE